jgi:hypothetical protein
LPAEQHKLSFFCLSEFTPAVILAFIIVLSVPFWHAYDNGTEVENSYTEAKK